MKNFPAIFIFLIGLNVFSQNKKIDSLVRVIKKDNPDTNKLNHLNKLVKEYYKAGEYSSSINSANSAVQLCSNLLKENEDPAVKQATQKALISFYTALGVISATQGNYPGALKNHTASLKISEATGNKKGISDSYINIGNVYYALGNHTEALKNYFAALKMYEATGNKKGIANSYNNIGSIYNDQGNHAEALKNYAAALKMKESIGDKAGMASSYKNIGLVYCNQGNYSDAIKNQSAALKIEEETGDQQSLADSYNNFGIIYSQQGNYLEALKNDLVSLKIRETIGDKAGLANSYINVGNVLTKLALTEKTESNRSSKFGDAEEYLIKGKELSEEIGDKKSLRDVFMVLTNLDSARKNFKGAYENHKLSVLYRDSLDNEETRKKTIQSQMTYDFEKKEAVADAEHKKELENQQTLSEEKSRKQKIVLGFTVFGLLLVLVFAGFIFRSLRTTRKQKKLIEIQKNEVLKQKEIVEEKQKEILDSIYYARRIQRALLTNEFYFDKVLNRRLKKR